MTDKRIKKHHTPVCHHPAIVIAEEKVREGKEVTIYTSLNLTKFNN